MTAPPRFPRRICAHCHQVKVKKAEHKYCSDACARAGRRKARPLWTLDDKVQAKCKRDGISLRALTLTLWRMWSDGEIAINGTST